MRKFINGKWTELTPVKPQAQTQKIEENQQEQEVPDPLDVVFPADKKPKAPAKKKSGMLGVFKKKK